VQTRDIVAGHLAGVQKGALATAVVVDGTPYTYTGMKIDHGVVEQIEMYPYIPIPTHVGVTVFSSPVYDYFTKLFDLTKKVDFESVLFPLLAEERQLYSFIRPARKTPCPSDMGIQGRSLFGEGQRGNIGSSSNQPLTYLAFSAILSVWMH